MDSSEHVQWQTSSDGPRQPDPPEMKLGSRDPPETPQKYEDSLDAASAFLQKYEPTLTSSPPATWHSPVQSASLGANQSANISVTQPPKRAKGEVQGKYYRFSPNHLRAASAPLGSPTRAPTKNLLPIPELSASESEDEPSKPNNTKIKPAAESAPLVLGPPLGGASGSKPLPVPELSTASPYPPKGLVFAPLPVSVPVPAPPPPAVPQFDLSDSEDEAPETSVHPDLITYWTTKHTHRFIVYQITRKPESTDLWCRHSGGFSTLSLVKSWKSQPVKVGDIVNVVGELTAGPLIVVDHTLLVVVNPDWLVPVTTVAEAFKCERQVILRHRVRYSAVETSVHLIYGNIIHEAIQSCLFDHFSEKRLKALFEVLVQNYVQDLVTVNKTQAQALVELNRTIPNILKWTDLYCRTQPDYDLSVYRSSRRWRVGIRRSRYTELECWSPQYGILGKIDAVVEAQTSEGTKLVGLEVKTGKIQSAAHRAQSALYSILLEERFGSRAASYTLLWYSQDGDCTAVPALKEEIRLLIQKRNSIVSYFKNPHLLPAPISDSRACRMCFSRAACTPYVAAYQELDGAPPNDIEELVKEDTGHLSGEHLEFLESMDRALTDEDLIAQRSLNRLWLRSDATREEQGNCLSGLEIVKQMPFSDEAGGLNYIYKLGRTAPFPKDSQLRAGTNVFISSAAIICVATGRIQSIDGNSLWVASNQPFEGRVSLNLNDAQSFTAYSRGNFMSMFAPDQTKLLRLVVDLEPPRFTNINYKFQGEFNHDQTRAISLAKNAQDYAIIRGMPGTGKTTTIVSLCKLLSEQGQSVLLTGYTNSSVDNIVLKLMRKGLNVLRLGNSLGAIHPDVHEVCAAKKFPATKEELDELFLTPKIVATTSLSLRSYIFRVRRFDYCIVDEASQLTLPAALGALAFADKFILVGDDYQLRPLVRSTSKELQTSLFQRLAEKHPASVVNLTHQYRMNQDIMKLSSELVYEGRLRCANTQVAKQRLPIKLSPFVKCPPWLDPARAVVFVNTDGSHATETETSEGVYNMFEIALVTNMIKTFMANGVAPADIGVISVYNQQVKRLQEKLRQERQTVEVLTADKAQGRDKELIIISLVRSNDEGKVGQLLKDWRRINVVFTRAKCKLVIVGSRKTLRGAGRLDKFLEVIEKNKWVSEIE